MTTIDPPALTFPPLYQAAEDASMEQQRYFYAATAAQLGLLAAAAVLALLPEGRAGDVGPIATLLCFLGALALQATGVAARAESRWYDARAAAESIKTASWEFAVGGESFRLDDDTAEGRYMGMLRDVLARLSKLQIGAAGAVNASVTDSMKALRAAPLEVRAQSYERHRVDDQVRWYSGKAKTNKRRVLQLGAAVVLVEVVAVVLGVLRVNGTVGPDYLGACAAVAAGFVGWSQAKRYAMLAAAYAVTSQEVNLVGGTLDPTQGEDVWSQTVHDAEAAFSREHTMWLARRQGPL